MNFEAPDLSDFDIRALAEQKRLDCLGADSSLSFNVELLAEELKLTIIPVSGLKADFGLEAMPIFCDDQILVDEDAYDDTFAWYGRLRFTLMHEIAHYFLHKDYLMQITLRDVQEWCDYVLAVERSNAPLESQANEFAGRFLVPVDRLRLMIPRERDLVLKEYPSIDSSQMQNFVSRRLGRKFNVSPTVMSIRIKKENLGELLKPSAY